MAIGKESMERAAKAAKPAKSAKPAKADVVEKPSEAVMAQIVYQTSAGVLARDAGPNESFGVGDAMPVYYL